MGWFVYRAFKALREEKDIGTTVSRKEEVEEEVGAP
jgi:hypothetical protein